MTRQEQMDSIQAETRVFVGPVLLGVLGYGGSLKWAQDLAEKRHAKAVARSTRMRAQSLGTPAPYKSGRKRTSADRLIGENFEEPDWATSDPGRA